MNRTIARITTKRVLCIVRNCAAFIVTYAVANIIVTLPLEVYTEGPRVTFLRFGMTLPGSVCAAANAICVFLITILIERLHDD